MMQALLRNPLADPYVLGISGGAAVGALAAMLFAARCWMVDAGASAARSPVSIACCTLLARRDCAAARGAGVRRRGCC